MKCLSFFFALSVLLSGCGGDDVKPEPSNHLLRAFFIPIPGSNNYDWTHQDERSGVKDSLYTLTYIGHDVKLSIDGLSPVSLFQISTADSGNIKTFQEEYYVSDSVVISYGSNAASDSERVVLLKDTLRLGKKWRAANAYRTSDKIRVEIDAEIDAYYSIIHIGNNDYTDVYRITYYPIPTAVTVDTAFTNGARHVHYYARGVGKVLEMVYAPDSLLIWKNELVNDR